MKNSTVILLLFLLSCNPWVESSEEKVYMQTSIESILGDSKKIINARHNIDRAIIEFDVLDFDKDEFGRVGNLVDSLSWCSSSYDNSKYIVVPSNSSTSLETIWLSLDSKKSQMHVLVQFIPME